ncbi:MAG TPA: toprim domain-containing protein [Gemmataceae bacterium]|nr:toprim domain-containing protein [Gemmataceae bacterium]
MRNPEGAIIGIRLRFPDGTKRAIRGSKEGLFLPADLLNPTNPIDRLLIVEGPTDAAALLDLAYDYVIGRPSCTGGVKHLVQWCRRHQPQEAVIVADGDEPGQRGAERLARELLLYVPQIRVVVPTQHKDVREFRRRGGTREIFEEAIAGAPARRLVVTVGTPDDATSPHRHPPPNEGQDGAAVMK